MKVVVQPFPATWPRPRALHPHHWSECAEEERIEIGRKQVMQGWKRTSPTLSFVRTK